MSSPKHFDCCVAEELPSEQTPRFEKMMSVGLLCMLASLGASKLFFPSKFPNSKLFHLGANMHLPNQVVVFPIDSVRQMRMAGVEGYRPLR